MVGAEGVDPKVFHQIYDGTAPWDIGQPQPEVVRLMEAHQFHGRVLDVGCGTGENAILIAMSGHPVTAVDFVPAAIDVARQKSEERHVDVDWHVADALQLTDATDGLYDTVLDSGVFHVFGDDDRRRYVDQLTQVTAPAGLLHIIVFSDAEGGGDGPRRVRREELIAAFGDGWELVDLVETRYGISSRDAGARAWRGTWRRAGVRTR